MGNVETKVREIAQAILDTSEETEAVKQYFLSLVANINALTIQQLLAYVEQSFENVEQEIQHGKVNILTMHRAKGLTASEVFVAAAEDECIPGRAQAEPDLGDERRLLYVSLTRAQHSLYVTYCDRRTGRQKMLGARAGTAGRTLTQFLRNAPIHAENGQAYVTTIIQAQNQAPA